MRIRNLERPPEVDDQTLRTFLRLYQLETWIREMVYLELKAYYGLDWWAEVETLKPSIRTDLAERYRTKDKEHAHISTPENDPLWFVSFDSLLKIIFSAKMWKHFELYFTTKRVARARFDEIAPVRNRVAHCRSLHPYDLKRVEQLMLDFDQGFWRCCTSYGDERYIPKEFKNSVDAYPWRTHRTGVEVRYTIRPSIKTPKRMLSRGAIYDVRIVSDNLKRFFDYQEILRTTRASHRFALHIVMDFLQHSMRITLPATITEDRVIEIIEHFIHACQNCYSIFPLVESAEETLGAKRQDGYRPFQLIASKWPHYVIPPSHPYAYLDGSCPCSFFGVNY